MKSNKVSFKVRNIHSKTLCPQERKGEEEGKKMEVP